MSTHILSACWALKDMSSTQKLVLISLADQANDDGVCWPSFKRMKERTCLSERAIRDAISWLKDANIVNIQHRFNSSSIYIVTPADYAPPAPAAAPPAPAAAPPAPAAAPPRHQLPPNRNIEPTSNLQGTVKGKMSFGASDLVKIGVSQQIADDFIAIRKAKRSPLTQTALDGIKREADKAGITLEDALRVCIERGWQGFKADWYQNQGSPKQPTGRRMPAPDDFDNKEYESGFL